MGLLRRVHGVTEGLTEVRLRPGQETSLALPYLTYDLLGANALHSRKNLWHCWDLLAPPSDSPPGHCAALVTPLVWNLAINCAAVKFAEPWMSKHFSKFREHNHVSSVMHPECPTKDWWGKSCWLNPRDSDSKIVQAPGGVTSSPTLLGPVLVWSQQKYLKLLLIVRFFKSSYGCCHRWNKTFQYGGCGLSGFGLVISVWGHQSRHFCT